MKVVTICGSMKFLNKMLELAWHLEVEKGFCVFQPVAKVGDEQLTADEIQNIKNAHFKKIDLSDAIFVVNVGGYIGESTKREIEYAKKHGKEVLYYENAE